MTLGRPTEADSSRALVLRFEGTGAMEFYTIRLRIIATGGQIGIILLAKKK